MSPTSARGLVPTLVAATTGALLVLTLLVLAPQSVVASVSAAGDSSCTFEKSRAEQTARAERKAAEERIEAREVLTRAERTFQRNPTSANRDRLNVARGRHDESVQEHDLAKRSNAAAKKRLRQCQRG